MLDFLFRRLTAGPTAGAALFDSATEAARRPFWYRDGAIPDTLDGRFAVLSTIIALILVRLERDGKPGDRLSVGLTERFIAVMESEHRELGLGDPTLGKTVRKLVGSLARRVDLWRRATGGETEWNDAVRQSMFKAEAEPDTDDVENCSSALKELWAELQGSDVTRLAEGRLE